MEENLVKISILFLTFFVISDTIKSLRKGVEKHENYKTAFKQNGIYKILQC